MMHSHVKAERSTETTTVLFQCTSLQPSQRTDSNMKADFKSCEFLMSSVYSDGSWVYLNLKKTVTNLDAFTPNKQTGTNCGLQLCVCVLIITNNIQSECCTKIHITVSKRGQLQCCKVSDFCMFVTHFRLSNQF